MTKKIRFIFFSILLITLMHLISIKLILPNPSSTTEYIIITNNQESFPVFGPNTWLFNQRTAQYSTKIFLTQNDLTIEALAFFNYDSEQRINIFERIKCVLLIRGREKAHVYELTSVVGLETRIYDQNGLKRKLWKIKCEGIQENIHLSDFKNIQIAITDFNEYLTQRSQFSNYLLSFQTPNFYDIKKSRKKAVGHCVHTVSDLNPKRLRRMQDWLRIQKLIGIDKVRLYMTDTNEQNELALKEEFKEFVEIVDYRLDFEIICKFAIKMREKSEYLFKNCLDFHKVFFNHTKDYGVYESHGKVATNDCLLNFKYQYQFGTNYDFDEFIFPRHLDSNNYDYFLSGNFINREFNYNIYDYALRLMKKYGSNKAYFQFENVAFLTFSKNSSFIEKLFSNHKNIEIIESGKTMSVQSDLFDIFRRSLNYSRLQDYITCLNQTIRQRNNVDSIWNMPYALLINYRLGKSIYNFEFASTFSQHDSQFVTPRSRKFTVPLSDGFTSHYREDFSEFLRGQHLSFSHFKIDLEFYHYLASLDFK